MKKTTYVNSGLVIIFLLIGLQAFSQNFVPFTPRFNQDIKGDIVLIGNNILGPDNNAFNNNSVYNHRVNMQYIDIDGDASTFSSSSADLVIPDPDCYNIIHAGLYWSAVNSGSEPITNVKLKGPTGGYNDVTGTVIFDAGTSSVDGGNSFPYACYADVTSIINGLGSNLGTYTVANVSSAEGRTASDNPYNGTGHSAGWSLFIVYENPTLPGKSITSFDGFSAISRSNNPTLDVPVSGFRTVPAPTPVRANFAFAALEGDKPIRGDRLSLNGVRLSAPGRHSNNFFNSSIAQLSGLPVNNRNPNSTNTLGFDTGVISVPNAGNTVIANGATSATVSLSSRQDTYFPYFYALAVDIIEPKIVLTKIVEDAAGNDIGGQVVNLGDELNYVIGFQNTGNDNATNLIIRDILPNNIVFNYPADLDILPPGVTVQSYNAATRELIFEVDDAVVEENDPVQEIRFKVTVVRTCSLLNDACDNVVDNQAFATYNGTLNPTFTISDDPSYNTNSGCLINPAATNFLSDIDCTFTEEVILCGDSTVLTAGSGYDTYSWSTSPTGTPEIGTTQSITVTTPGTYYVRNTATAPCQSINQEFEVITYGAGVTNPMLPFADQVVTCPNDGKQLPNFFLCGTGDTRDIQTNITDASSIIWERLDETSCAAVTDQDCANEDPGCTWNQVATGPNYLIDTAGQYRLTLNYTGGCFNQFYFNVYTNILTPTVSSRDIYCTTPGEIVVGGVPAGYEYSIDGTNYQASNTFSINTQGIYSVYVRQIGVSPNPCIFSVPDVQIRERNFTTSINIIQPLCNGDFGSVVLAANDVRPQYFYSIEDAGGTLVNSSGLTIEDNYTFANLNPGTYTVNINTEDGCTHTESIEITNPPLLEATAAITQPLTCTDGEITVYPAGGTPPYYYFVNSTTDFQTTPIIPVTTAGVYNITVYDYNNCYTTTSITIDAVPEPDFTIAETDILCADDPNSGSININVSNPNGNSLRYSIDNGATFFNSPDFTGLAAGDYDVVLEYTFGADVCLTTPQSVTIDAATDISGTATLTTPYTCTTDGVITVSGVSGGNPPYTYSLDGFTFQTGTTFSGLTDGTYTVTIRDANNCTFVTAPVTIDPLNPPTDLTFSHTALSCPTIVADVTITGTTDGTLPLEYQIIAPAASATAYQTSNVFSGLAPGTYTFQIRDANNCVYSENYTIDDLPPISVVAQTTSDVGCFGGADGTVQYNVSGTINFNYSINGGAPQAGTSPINLTGLSAGIYSILITDNDTNCTATASTIVEGPSAALTLSATTSPITCNEDGSVRLTATGGWGGNTFTVTQPDATSAPTTGGGVFSGLTQTGTYTATVTDANGCVATTTFVLDPYIAPTASVAASSDLCYNSTTGASLEVTASGGQTPYQYSINGGAFVNTNTFTNLTPDTYVVTVRDAYGCDVVLPAQIIAPQLSLNTVLNKGLDCTASPDAEITGTFSGGYAPYTYAVSFNGGAYTDLGATGSPFTYSASTDGTYQFRVTDAQGCTAFSAVETVNAISLPEITSLTPTAPLCHGDSSGSIDVVINNAVGTPPFTINVFNTTTGTDYGTQTSSLPAGDYTITLTDANSCTDIDTVTIGEPNPITIDYDVDPITCGVGGVSLGRIIINSVTGGTPNYTYHVTGANGYNNQITNQSGGVQVFEVVDFGLYEIIITDTNGCTYIEQDILVASPPDDLDISINATADCISGGTAEISIGTPLAGSGPFHFAIYTTPGMTYPGPSWQPEDAVGSEKTTFNNLIPGAIYTFIVYDENTMCYYYETAAAPIPTNSSLTVDSVVPNNITCTGSADGNVSFNINSTYGASTNVDYEILNSQTLLSTGISGSGVVPPNGTLSVPNLGNLSFGNYIILVTETVGATNEGCSVTTQTPFNITESAILLDINATVDANANCNANSGVITAIATHGTAPYLYQITTSAVPPLATDPSWASASTFNVDAGSYYVHVKDAYGCIDSTPQLVVPPDPAPVVTAVNSNPCTATEGNFEIDVALTTMGIAPYSFSIDGGAFQVRTAPFTITGLSSGSHTVEVRDANGCGNLVTVNIEAPLGVSATATALPTCAINDGEITVTGAGGSGSYTYGISPSPATIVPSGNTFTGVPAGTYTITITDTATGCTNTTTVSLDAATPVTFDAPTVTDVTCNGGSDGLFEVNLSPTNDNPVYTYQIIAGPTTTVVQNSNVFTGLAAGTYTVEVNSGRGCTNTQDITVAEPPVLTASGSATAFACAADNSVNPSTLTVTASGGTAPYTYSIDGTNYLSTNTFAIVDTSVVQNITFYVRDHNGCDTTGSILINPLTPITSTFTGTPVDCNATGTVTVNATGGSGSFEYRLLPDGVAQASNVFPITAPGNYYFEITDITTGCYITTAGYNVAPYDTATITLTPTAPVTCFGDNSGAFELLVNGYSGNYTYSVLDSSGTPVPAFTNIPANTSTNPISVTGMAAGTYSVEITETESPFCSASSTVIINSPAAALSLTASETSNVTCDNNIGTITAVASGGWGSLEYQLTNTVSGAVIEAYSANRTFNNLSAGDYTVTVRDAVGCEVSDDVTLAIPPPITAVALANTPILSCFDDANATITVTASGGQGSNYSYTLNTIAPTASSSGPQSSNVFTGLGAGTYNVSVTDGYNCSVATTNVVITQPAPIQASLVAATTTTCTTDASLTLSASGGTGPYQYSDSASFATVLGSFASSVTIANVSPGTYQYYVRDANGCVSSVSNEITIEPTPTLMVDLDTTNASINCAGDETGVIIATAQGGLGSYVYTLQDATGTDIAPAPVQTSPGVFTGLPVGTYQVYVESGDCLVTSAQTTIAQPTALLTANSLVTNVTCAGSNNGIMEITASGGTGIIKYAISPQLNQFFDSPIFEDLAPGTYQAIAQDELGCFVILDFTVNEPAPVILTIVPNSTIPEVCSGDLDGEFSIEISGGTLPYSVSLDDINGTYTTGAPTQTQFDFTGLAGGDHVVYVRDAQGCESEWNITFPPSVLIDPTVEVDFGCTNNLSTNTVTVTVDASVNPSDLDYSLNGGAYQTSNVFVDVPPGINHFIDVRHTNGCIQTTGTFDIEAYDPLTLTLEDGALNEIVATASGGTGDYEFTLNGVSYGSTNNFFIYASGDYTVTVTDNYGCFASVTRYFEYVDVCIPNYFTPNGDGNQDEWGPGCTDQYTEMTFDIFDRYGRKIATMRIGEKWDGKYNGKQLPTGDYWYVIRLNDKNDDREFVGHFTLYR